MDELVPYDAILLEEARNSSIKASYQRFPIRDNSVPSDSEHLAEILFAIDRRIREEGAVYLHCWGGVGRTGLVVACWLQEHGRTPGDALAELSAKWSTVEKIIGNRNRLKLLHRLTGLESGRNDEEVFNNLCFAIGTAVRYWAWPSVTP